VQISKRNSNFSSTNVSGDVIVGGPSIPGGDHGGDSTGESPTDPDRRGQGFAAQAWKKTYRQEQRYHERTSLFIK
jgi:hypothetical protein